MPIDSPERPSQTIIVTRLDAGGGNSVHPSNTLLTREDGHVQDLELANARRARTV
jgi:hypothetical protein